MDDGPTLATCRREIEELHDFFVAWYTGACDRDEFERMGTVIAPGFEMVTPDGHRVGRDGVLGMVRDGHGGRGPGAFDIDIRNVELLDSGDDYPVARYEEWQTSPGDENGRISTALFRADAGAPNGLVWVSVHETWLESG